MPDNDPKQLTQTSFAKQVKKDIDEYNQLKSTNKNRLEIINNIQTT